MGLSSPITPPSKREGLFLDEIQSMDDLNRKCSIDFNTQLPLRNWLRSARFLHKQGGTYLEEKDLIRSYIYYMQFSLLILSYLPEHPEYNAPFYAKDLDDAQENARQVLGILESLKPILEEGFVRGGRGGERNGGYDLALKDPKGGSNETVNDIANDSVDTSDEDDDDDEEEEDTDTLDDASIYNADFSLNEKDIEYPSLPRIPQPENADINKPDSLALPAITKSTPLSTELLDVLGNGASTGSTPLASASSRTSLPRSEYSLYMEKFNSLEAEFQKLNADDTNTDNLPKRNSTTPPIPPKPADLKPRTDALLYTSTNASPPHIPLSNDTQFHESLPITPPKYVTPTRAQMARGISGMMVSEASPSPVQNFQSSHEGLQVLSPPPRSSSYTTSPSNTTPNSIDPRHRLAAVMTGTATDQTTGSKVVRRAPKALPATPNNGPSPTAATIRRLSMKRQSRLAIVTDPEGNMVAKKSSPNQVGRHASPPTAMYSTMHLQQQQPQQQQQRRQTPPKISGSVYPGAYQPPSIQQLTPQTTNLSHYQTQPNFYQPRLSVPPPPFQQPQPIYFQQQQQVPIQPPPMQQVAPHIQSGQYQIPHNAQKHHHHTPGHTQPRISGESPATLRPRTGFLENGLPLRTVHLPSCIIPVFLRLAESNTKKNLETCAILSGVLRKDSFYITTLIVPKQTATSDSCATTHEEELFEYQFANDLITLGWIHTHPTQSCFMSSVDLHTHCSYQLMLPEAIAIVCSPRHQPSFGIFRLTQPPGMDVIVNCKDQRMFHPHPNVVLYTDVTRGLPGSHVDFFNVNPVAWNHYLKVVDLRRS